MRSAQDFDVRPAATEVAGELATDLFVGRATVPQEKSRRCHDHSIGAVAALGGLFIDECPLDGMWAGASSKPLQRSDHSAFHSPGRNNTGPRCDTVHQHGACTALSQAASVLWAIEPEVVAQHMHQACVWPNEQGALVAVDAESDLRGREAAQRCDRRCQNRPLKK